MFSNIINIVVKMNNQSIALIKMKNLASIVQKMNKRSKTNPPGPQEYQMVVP